MDEGFLPGAAGAKLFYRVLGDGRDPVVVVHGGPGAGMGAILPHVAALAEGRRLILYDQRGGGRSTLPEDESELGADYFVEDLEAVRRHFGIGRLAVIAHSFGAILVAKYAERYPERIERMVFLKATGPERKQAGAAARAAQPQGEDAATAAYRDALRSLMEGTAEDPLATCRELERLGRVLQGEEGSPWRGTTCDAPPKAIAYYYRKTAQVAPASFGAWDFTTSLSDLAAPLLVVAGEANAEPQCAWTRAVPDARLLVVPGTGTTPIAERPDVVHPAIDRFLRGRWPREAADCQLGGADGTLPAP